MSLEASVKKFHVQKKKDVSGKDEVVGREK
jgi:hypothetical protein